jgi:hypothetical protein
LATRTTRPQTKTSTSTTEMLDAPAVAGRDAELIARMRQGVTVDADAPLEMRGGANRELRARLALIEAGLLAELHGRGPLAEDLGVAVDQGVKAKILAKLGSLDD